MSTRFLIILATAASLGGCSTAESSKSKKISPTKPAKNAKTQPVAKAKPTQKGERKVALVELFTSQGCSSCPPADRLLSRVNKAVDDVEVIPLAFHVDYWNYIGWKDPFSNAKWSARQRQYAQRLNRGSSYTPQLVINGKGHAVGSNRGAVFEQIREHALSGKDLISVDKAVVGAESVSFKIDVSKAASLKAEPSIVVAVYENDLVTKIKRGENTGRTLTNDFVVRDTAQVKLTPSKDSYRLKIPVQSAWKKKNLGAVVFMRTATGEVLSTIKVPVRS